MIVSMLSSFVVRPRANVAALAFIGVLSVNPVHAQCDPTAAPTARVDQSESVVEGELSRNTEGQWQVRVTQYWKAPVAVHLELTETQNQRLRPGHYLLFGHSVGEGRFALCAALDADGEVARTLRPSLGVGVVPVDIEAIAAEAAQADETSDQNSNGR